MTDEDRSSFDPFAPPPATKPAVTDAVAPTTDQAPSSTEHSDLPEDLDELRKAELVELAEERGLDTEGTKAEIIERLRGL